MPKGSKILMADDDQMLLDMYKERLELAGYVVSTCTNGEETLKKVRDERPDIILLDVMMPKIDGYATLTSLKSDPQTKNIPVVMLTALMRDFNRQKAIESGADDYLIKSEAMPSDVITKIEQVLANYRQNTGAIPTAAPSAPQTTTPPAPPATTPSATAPADPEANTIPTPQAAQPTAQEPSGPVAIETHPVGSPMPPQMAPLPPEIDQMRHTPPDKSYTEKQLTNTPAEPSKRSMVWIIILVILLTTLINDAIMYYFFIWKK